MNASDKVKSEGFWFTFKNQTGIMQVVPDEWRDELYNYIICGYPPGSFHTACFANDLFSAACKSHVSNEWRSIVAMMRWLSEHGTTGCWGSYENVAWWIALEKEERNEILLQKGYIMTDEEVTWKILEAENEV